VLLYPPPPPAQVLFVLSADRPLSESEVKFLQYIRKWRKKVVFLVNKVDMLDGREQVGGGAVLRVTAFDKH
jgi:predicted GTPase